MNFRNLLICGFVLAAVSCANTDNNGQNSDLSALYAPGDTIPADVVKNVDLDTYFKIEMIPDDIFEIMKGKSYKDDCTIPRETLRYITCLHKNKAGESIVGELVINEKIAETVLSIFRKLYDAGYPIERMRLIDYFDADDETSMRANNSSAFNFRFISHTTKLSSHSEGYAVDINPLYNPYVKKLADGTVLIEPATGGPYVDRDSSFDYKIVREDLACQLFLEAGFEWGGDWTSVKDYQHFEYIKK